MGYYAIVARFIHFKHWVQGGRGPTVLTFSQFCLNLLLYPFDQILRAGPRMANDHFFFFKTVALLLRLLFLEEVLRFLLSKRVEVAPGHTF